ncbi:MAG: hypothetical protein ACO395_02175, partial [Pontimonas sp.]
VRLARKTVSLFEMLGNKEAQNKLSDRDRMRVLDALDDVASGFSRVAKPDQLDLLREKLGLDKRASVSRLIGTLYEQGYITKKDRVEQATVGTVIERIAQKEEDAKNEKNERFKQSFLRYVDQFKSEQLDDRINQLREAIREDAKAQAEYEAQEATHKKFIEARSKLLDEGGLNTEAMLSDVEAALDEIDLSLPRGWKASNVADKAMEYLKKYRYNRRERTSAGRRYDAIYDAVFRRANNEALEVTGLTYEEALQPDRVYPKAPRELSGYDIAIMHLKDRATQLGLDVFDYVPNEKELYDLAARGLQASKQGD